MRVFIIGGTGFIGPHVVRMLHEQEHHVTVFHRGQSKTALPEGVGELRGERARLGDFRARIGRFHPNVVIDMIPLTEADAQLVVSVFAGIANRLVVVSSQDVYRAYDVFRGLDTGPLEPVPLTEESALRTRLFPYREAEPRPPDDPQRWMDDYDKILVERAVMEAKGLCGTVLRLPMVYGPNDRQHRTWEYVRRMIDARPAILMEDSLASWRWTRGYVENVAAAIVLAATDDRAFGKVFNVGEPDALGEAGWVDEIGHASGWPGRIVTLPGSWLPESLRASGNLDQHMVADTTRLRAELGYREHVPRDEAIRRTVEWEAFHTPRNAGTRHPDYALEDQVLAVLPPT